GRGTTAHVWEVESLATSPPDPVFPADDAEVKAVEAITKLGGKVTRDDKLPGKPVIGVSFFGTQVTDAGLKELEDLKQLTALYLAHTKVTGEGAQELQTALPKLKIEGAPEPKEVVAKRKAAAEKKRDIEDRQIRMKLRDGELYLNGP